METSTTKLILEITKKLHEYERNRREVAWSIEDDEETQNFFLGEASGFNIAMDIVAEISKSHELSEEELNRAIRKKAILGV